jgi:type IV pilus assembly protein PilE
MHLQRRNSGFTLIEIMVVVAIIGILAKIALPAYSAYIQRGKTSEAFSTLADSKIKLEQYYQDNRNYGSTASACGVAMPTSTVKYFTYTCNWGTGGTNQSFLMTATGVSTEGMSGFTYTIDHNNAKATTSYAGTAMTRTCWIAKSTDTC